MSRLLKRGQIVPEANPCEIVTEPGVMRWGKQIWVVETTCRDVDEPNAIAVMIRQRSSAGRAKPPTYWLGRMKLGRLPAQQLKPCRGECDPGDRWCACNAPTRLTMTHHAVGWCAIDSVANCSAHTAALSNGCWHRESFPQVHRQVRRRHPRPLTSARE